LSNLELYKQENVPQKTDYESDKQTAERIKAEAKYTEMKILLDYKITAKRLNEATPHIPVESPTFQAKNKKPTQIAPKEVIQKPSNDLISDVVDNEDIQTRNRARTNDGTRKYIKIQTSEELQNLRRNLKTALNPSITALNPSINARLFGIADNNLKTILAHLTVEKLPTGTSESGATNRVESYKEIDDWINKNIGQPETRKRAWNNDSTPRYKTPERIVTRERYSLSDAPLPDHARKVRIKQESHSKAVDLTVAKEPAATALTQSSIDNAFSNQQKGRKNSISTTSPCTRNNSPQNIR